VEKENKEKQKEHLELLFNASRRFRMNMRNGALSGVKI